VYKSTVATVKRQIQQAENPTPATVISRETAPVANLILLDYLTSEVALEKSEIRSTDPNIPIDNNCTDDELHFGMPGCCEDYDDESDIIEASNAITTASRDAGPQLNSRVWTWEPVISTGLSAMIATMQMRIRRKKNRKPMKD
jgi:hypothetical protein